MESVVAKGNGGKGVLWFERERKVRFGGEEKGSREGIGWVICTKSGSGESVT